MTTGLESLSLFRVQFSASNNAFDAQSLFSLHIISKSKCFFATFFSHSAIFSFAGIISDLWTSETGSIPVPRPASPMIPDLVRLQFHLSFVPFPLFELQFQIEFLIAPYFDRQCPVTDFFSDVLNIFVTNRPWTPDF